MGKWTKWTSNPPQHAVPSSQVVQKNWSRLTRRWCRLREQLVIADLERMFWGTAQVNAAAVDSQRTPSHRPTEWLAGLSATHDNRANRMAHSSFNYSTTHDTWCHTRYMVSLGPCSFVIAACHSWSWFDQHRQHSMSCHKLIQTASTRFSQSTLTSARTSRIRVMRSITSLADDIYNDKHTATQSSTSCLKASCCQVSTWSGHQCLVSDGCALLTGLHVTVSVSVDNCLHGKRLWGGPHKPSSL